MRRPSTTLTTAELEIMHVVWGLGRATVRDVYEALRERRQVAYTSVMTVMKILEQKGYLKKKQEEVAKVAAVQEAAEEKKAKKRTTRKKTT